MSRLPIVGSDDSTWGDILNDFLSQSLASNGALQPNAVTSGVIAPGAVTKTTVGLANVDNTSDVNKPVSTAQQSALDAKENAGVAIPKSLVDAKGDLVIGTADNTLGRLAVGADGYTLVADSTQTSGVRWATNVSVTTIASSATLTPTGDGRSNEFYVTALAVNLTIGAPSGTAANGNSLLMRFKDNGTARTLTWNPIYRAIGITLMTTTTAGKTLYIGAKYNSTDLKWDVLALGVEA